MNIKNKPQKRGEIKRIFIDNPDIRYFVNKLENTSFNLDIFYKNIKTLKIIEVPRHKMSFKTSEAEYNLFLNIIRYCRDSYKRSIMHELFHLSSTIKGKNRIYSGFCQTSLQNGEFIGLGLNEGYTALLDERYFADYTDDKKNIILTSYPATKHFVGMIESFVGSEAMEQFYSTCDLEGLTNVLAKHTSLENTLNFYEALDVICLNLESKNTHRYKDVINAIEYCVKYTALLYLDLMQEAYLKEQISDFDYSEFIDDLKYELAQSIIIGDFIKKRTNPIVGEEFNKLVDNSMKLCIKKYT